MKKMLYMCHIDWGWIKQRPQFLAEALTEHFSVSVMYMYQNRNRENLQKRVDEKISTTPLYTIPFFGRIKPLRIINNLFMRMQFSKKLKSVGAEYVFLTYPDQINFIPKWYKGKILYDCMDDHVAMVANIRKNYIKQCEEKLTEKADTIFVSSENLCKKLIATYKIQNKEKLSVIRNGYNGKIFDVQQNFGKKKNDFTLSYIGTVSHWFDFDNILKSLEDFDNVKYKIIGPIEPGLTLPSSERIEFMGTIEHNALYDNIKDTDALIMPFKINEIIKSVDPVKLYEYINYNMNILSVRYDEIIRFDNFVYFYNDYNEYKESLQKMIDAEKVKYSSDERQAFLEQSNWNSRAKQILEIIG